MAHIFVEKISETEILFKIDDTEICIIRGRSIKCKRYDKIMWIGKRINIRLVKHGNNIVLDFNSIATIIDILLTCILMLTRDELYVNTYAICRMVREFIGVKKFTCDRVPQLLQRLKHVKVVNVSRTWRGYNYVLKLVEPIELPYKATIEPRNSTESVNKKIGYRVNEYRMNHIFKWFRVCNIELKYLPRILNILKQYGKKFDTCMKIYYIYGDIIITVTWIQPLRTELPDIKAFFAMNNTSSIIYNGDDFYKICYRTIRRVKSYYTWLRHMKTLYPNVKICTQSIEYISGRLRKKCFEKYIDFM